MGLLDDILNALDRVPVWKRLQGMPAEVDELGRRVAELEEKLGGKWPADICRHCGARAARLYHSRPANDRGIVMETWSCQECGQSDMRSHKAK